MNGSTPALDPTLAEIGRRLRRIELLSDVMDVERQMRAIAARSSAEYALANMITAQPIRAAKYAQQGVLDLIEHALSLVSLDGFYAEFGVFKGHTLRFIADRTTEVVYGLDAFEGLPEDWFLGYRKGAFDVAGALPDLGGRSNVQILKGWFRETARELAELTADRPAAFLHVDCDLYSSTRDVLFGIAERIVPNTVILFDEYLNYPGWEAGEVKAFREFCDAFGVTYRYAAFAPAAQSVAVVIEGKTASR